MMPKKPIAINTDMIPELKRKPDEVEFPPWLKKCERCVWCTIINTRVIYCPNPVCVKEKRR